MKRTNGPFSPIRSFLSCGGSLSFAVGVTLVASLLFCPRTRAQRAPGNVTTGLQVGSPGGVTAKVYRAGHTAYSGLFTTDGDDFATLFAHRVREPPLPDSLLHGFIGPGGFVGVLHLPDAPVPEVGISALLGLNFYSERFEVFLNLTPTLRLFPKRNGEPALTLRPNLGGSVGLRYHLRRR